MAELNASFVIAGIHGIRDATCQVVMSAELPTSRLDPAGILYVGQSLCLRDRLWNFWYAQHEASGILWDIPQVARAIFSTPVCTSREVDPLIASMMVRVATPIPHKMLNQAERAVLYAYTLRFGEPPPLNSCLPDRWSKAPKTGALRWAEKGLAKV